MSAIDNRPLDIIEHYGPKHQQRKLAEENFELQEVLTEVRLEESKELCERHRQMLTDEITDNLVMLVEFIKYYNLDKEELEKRFEYKLDRQSWRIKNDEGKI